MHRNVVAASVGLMLFGAGGCGRALFSQTLWNPLGVPLPKLDQNPIRIGIIAQAEAMPETHVLWDLGKSSPYADLQEELAYRLGKAVQFESMKPFQIAAHLQSGRLQFAFVSKDDYAEVCSEGPVVRDTGEASRIGEVIAIAEPGERQALIIASAKSDVQGLADLKGKRFAFGPRGDSALHYGANETLGKAGVTVDLLAKELVPIGALQHHISSYEAAKEVVYGIGTPAGVIDKAEYDALPETGGKFINPIQPALSKDQFRVLGETPKAEEGRVLAGANCDAKLRQKVQAILLEADSKNPDVVAAMGLARFTRPPNSSAGDTAARH